MKNNGETAEAIRELRKLLKPGDTVYTILRHCSRSGMQRVIELVIPYIKYHEEYPLKPGSDYARDYDAEPKRVKVGPQVRIIGGWAARAMGYSRSKKYDGIITNGCGMDMGFELVYNLGRTLWPKGTVKPHGMRNGQPDRDGGYALKHQWL